MIYQSGAPRAFLASAEMMLAPVRRCQARDARCTGHKLGPEWRLSGGAWLKNGAEHCGFAVWILRRGRHRKGSNSMWGNVA